MVEEIVAIVFLVIAAVEDLKERKISIVLCMVFGSMGGIINYITNGHSLGERVSGVLLGFIFIGISVLTKEKIGLGDSLVIFVLGFLLGGTIGFRIVMWGFVICSLTSIAAIILFKKKGNYCFPFVPFLLLGTIMEYLCR